MCNAIQPSQASTPVILTPDRHLQHGVAAADRGHGALVAVVEGLGVQAAMQPGDLPGRVLAGLEGRLGQLGQRRRR